MRVPFSPTYSDPTRVNREVPRKEVTRLIWVGNPPVVAVLKTKVGRVVSSQLLPMMLEVGRCIRATYWRRTSSNSETPRPFVEEGKFMGWEVGKI